MGKTSKQAKQDDDSPTSTAMGFACLLLFALPFALAGTGMGVVVARDLLKWRAAQSWVETPATVVASGLDENNDGDSTTFRVTATYLYEVQGKPYTSQRVVLNDGRDNVGSFHKDRAKELEAIRNAGGKTTCFVDPDDPTDAVLFRDGRPGYVAMESVFALTFCGVGYGLLAFAAIGYRETRRTAQLKLASPNEPWRWRADWAAGRVRPSDSATAWGVTIFAVIWNAFCWPVFFLVWNDARAGGGPPILLVALFPAAGTLMGVWAIYLWMRRLSWGVSEFELATVPGVLGGPLAGMIHTPGGIHPENGFTLRLACIKTTKTTSGGESSTQTETLWESEQKIDRDLSTSDGGQTLIPVKFLVPYEMPPSGKDVKWQLEVKAERVGIDYAATFEAPVFMTAASSRSVKGQTDPALDQDADGRQPDFAATVARMNARLDQSSPDRRTIVFPMARNRSMAAFVALFTAAWTGICVVLFLSAAPRYFPWVFTLFDVFMLYATTSACFVSTRLEYGPRDVAYCRRWFGVGRRHEIASSSITSVDVDKSGTTFGSTAYQKVVMDASDGHHTLVTEIARRIDAERLAADIRRVVGLEAGSPNGEAAMKLDSDLPSDFLDSDKS